MSEYSVRIILEVIQNQYNFMKMDHLYLFTETYLENIFLFRTVTIKNRKKNKHFLFPRVIFSINAIFNNGYRHRNQSMVLAAFKKKYTLFLRESIETRYLMIFAFENLRHVSFGLA